MLLIMQILCSNVNIEAKLSIYVSKLGYRWFR